jgi:hypothetical protein
VAMLAQHSTQQGHSMFLLVYIHPQMFYVYLQVSYQHDHHTLDTLAWQGGLWSAQVCARLHAGGESRGPRVNQEC